MFSFVWGIPSFVSGFTSTKPLSSSPPLFQWWGWVVPRIREEEEEERKRDRISHFILLSGIFGLAFYTVYTMILYIFRTTSISFKKLFLVIRFWDFFSDVAISGGKKEVARSEILSRHNFPKKKMDPKEKKLQEKNWDQSMTGKKSRKNGAKIPK